MNKRKISVGAASNVAKQFKTPLGKRNADVIPDSGIIPVEAMDADAGPTSTTTLDSAGNASEECYFPFKFAITWTTWNSETFGQLFDALFELEKKMTKKIEEEEKKNLDSKQVKWNGKELFEAIGKAVCVIAGDHKLSYETLNNIYLQCAEYSDRDPTKKPKHDVNLKNIAKNARNVFADKVAKNMQAKSKRISPLKQLIREHENHRSKTVKDDIKLKAIFNGLFTYLLLQFYQIRLQNEAKIPADQSGANTGSLPDDLQNARKYFEEFKISSSSFFVVDWSKFEKIEFQFEKKTLTQIRKATNVFSCENLNKDHFPPLLEFEKLVEKALKHYVNESNGALEKVKMYLETQGTDIEKTRFMTGVNQAFRLVQIFNKPGIRELRYQMRLSYSEFIQVSCDKLEKSMQ